MQIEIRMASAFYLVLKSKKNLFVWSFQVFLKKKKRRKFSLTTILILFLPVVSTGNNSGLKIKKPLIDTAGYFPVSVFLVLKSIRGPAKIPITYYTRSTCILHINLAIRVSLYGVGRTNISPKIMSKSLEFINLVPCVEKRAWQMWLRLWCGDYSGLSMWPQPNHESLKAEKLSWWSERNVTGRSSERCNIRTMCLSTSSSVRCGGYIQRLERVF